MLSQLNIKIFHLFFFALLFTFTSCKKYSEDGKYSFQRVSERIKTFWILKECIVNGENVTHDEISFVYDPLGQNETLYYKLYDATLEFKYFVTKVGPNKTKNYRSYLSVYSDVNRSIGTTSDYSFTEKNKKIYFKTNYYEFNSYSSYIVVNQSLLYNPTDEPWEIVKLTDKELRLKVINSMGQEIRLKFNER